MSRGKLARTPPQFGSPISEAVSNPEIYHTPERFENSGSLRKSLKRSLLPTKDDFTASENATNLTTSDMFSNVLDMFRELKTSQDEQFTKISQEINTLKNQNENLLTANAEIKASLTVISEEQIALRGRIENLETSDKSLRGHIYILEEQIEKLDRKLKESTVEINNLPTENHAEMMTAIEQLHKVLKLEFDIRDICKAYRIPKPNKSSPIIVEFSNYLKKVQLVRAFKEYNKKNKEDRLNTSTLGLPGKKDTIYLNDLLTKKTRHLHYLARELIKKSTWKFCWAARGTVFIKQDEGHPAIEIKSEAQILALEREMQIVI